MPAHAFVYLASGSPRRRELLAQIGVPFRVLSVAVDEAARPGESVVDYVSRLAADKAIAGWNGLAEPARCPVLGADTAVLIDDRILGKPASRDEAVRMLLELARRTHEVLTAVAVRSAAGTALQLSRTEVTFRDITSAEAAAYWDTGEPADKAGGYAIQGFGATFVSGLNGSYSGVVGLPLFEAAELLAQAGVPRWCGS